MRPLAWIAPLLLLGLASCGTSDADRFSLRTPGTDDVVVREIDGSEKPRHGKPTPAEVRVIRGWADALRAGHVLQAARFFAVPAKVFNGGPAALMLTDQAAVIEFNRGLPCGAKLLRTRRGRDSYVVATFELTDRPGSDCGTGVGGLAATAFLIEKRHIVQWLRGPDPPQPENKQS